MYLLDTNIISYLIKNLDYSLIDIFEKKAQKDDIGVSVITVAELVYGAKKKGSKKLEIAIDTFLQPLEKVTFDENSAFVYGEIRASLEKQGELIGAYDMLIAAQAKQKGVVLVTNNVREFKKVQGLQIENWVKGTSLR